MCLVDKSSCEATLTYQLFSALQYRSQEKGETKKRVTDLKQI